MVYTGSARIQKRQNGLFWGRLLGTAKTKKMPWNWN
jgi:hypothetical protein